MGGLVFRGFLALHIFRIIDGYGQTISVALVICIPPTFFPLPTRNVDSIK
jgi:hypothetical protein